MIRKEQNGCGRYLTAPAWSCIVADKYYIRFRRLRCCKYMECSQLEVHYENDKYGYHLGNADTVGNLLWL
jgi:hypothetical protein